MRFNLKRLATGALIVVLVGCNGSPPASINNTANPVFNNNSPPVASRPAAAERPSETREGNQGSAALNPDSEVTATPAGASNSPAGPVAASSAPSGSPSPASTPSPTTPGSPSSPSAQPSSAPAGPTIPPSMAPTARPTAAPAVRIFSTNFDSLDGWEQQHDGQCGFTLNNGLTVEQDVALECYGTYYLDPAAVRGKRLQLHGRVTYNVQPGADNTQAGKLQIMVLTEDGRTLWFDSHGLTGNQSTPRDVFAKPDGSARDTLTEQWNVFVMPADAVQVVLRIGLQGVSGRISYSLIELSEIAK